MSDESQRRAAGRARWKGVVSDRLDRPAAARGGPSAPARVPGLPAVQPGDGAGRARRLRDPLRGPAGPPADQRGVRGRPDQGRPRGLREHRRPGAVRAPGGRARGPLGSGAHDAHRAPAGCAAHPAGRGRADVRQPDRAACALGCGAGRRRRGGDGPRRVRDAPERARFGDGPLRRRELPRRRRGTADHGGRRGRDLVALGCRSAGRVRPGRHHRLLAAPPRTGGPGRRGPA